MIQVTDHIVEGSEMVCHLCAFEQRATHRNHCHSLFAKDSRIIDSKRVALNGTGSDALVFLYFLLKHRGKDRDYFRNKQENGQKSLEHCG